MTMAQDYWIWQDAFRLSSIDDRFTVTWPLPEKTCVSAIYIELRGTNGSTSNVNNYCYDLIDKIEVILNGNQPAKSLTAEETQALSFYDRLEVPQDILTENADAVQQGEFPLHFGRYPGDDNYFLDMREFRSGQLKVTGNIANIRAAAADTAFVADSLEMTVKYMFHSTGNLEHKGWFRSLEVKDYANKQAADELIELDRTWPYRRILIRPYYETSCPKTEVEHIQLECNNKTQIPVEWWTEDLRDHNVTQMRCQPEFCMDVLKATTESTYPPIGEITDANMVLIGAGGITVGFSTKSCDTLTYSAGCFVATAPTPTWAALAATDLTQIWVKGKMYHYTMLIPFPQTMDYKTEQWFPANQFNNVFLRLRGYTAAAPSGNTQVVLEDVVAPGTFARI